MSQDHSIPAFPADISRDDFGHWLSGFTDGEGCFRLSFTIPKATSRAYHIFAPFLIRLRADDCDVLRQIQAYWGCGRLTPWAPHSSRKTFNSKPYAMLTVQRIDALAGILVPHFERFPLRAKKARDFAIWKQGVRLIHQAAHRHIMSGYHCGSYPRWTKDEIEEFSALARALGEQREFLATAPILPAAVPPTHVQPGLFD